MTSGTVAASASLRLGRHDHVCVSDGGAQGAHRRAGPSRHKLGVVTGFGSKQLDRTNDCLRQRLDVPAELVLASLEGLHRAVCQNESEPIVFGGHPGRMNNLVSGLVRPLRLPDPVHQSVGIQRSTFASIG
jgi:hypothetical protein